MKDLFSTRGVIGIVLFLGLILLPQAPLQDWRIPMNLLAELLIVSILALALNVMIGYTGLLHLGIAAFYGIGDCVAGILTTPIFPFQQSFLVTIIAATLVTALVGMAISAPVLRLRGDYLALVTLGFGEIVVVVLKEFSNITGGKQTLQSLYPPFFPGGIAGDSQFFRKGGDWQNPDMFYYVCLGILLVVYLALWNLERSKIGRSFVALREDELAATTMGLNPAKLKLLALTLGAGIAGLAGCLYAILNTNTTEPHVSFKFNTSVIVLASVILGGLGSRPGVLLGVLLLLGFDKILTRIIDEYLQTMVDSNKAIFKLSTWKLMVFGLVMILMMRFRPHGLIPEKRETEN
jgi:branched-chain amino acid transport system permease protein